MTVLISTMIGSIQLIISIILAVVALYAGSFTFSQIAQGIDVQRELARGNTAMGIFIGSVFIGISITVVTCIQGILIGLNKIFADGVLNMNDALDVVSSCLELIAGVLLAIGSIYLAIQVFSHLYRRTDMITAIEKGNNAIACMVAAMIFAVSVIIHFGVLGIITAVL
jgi:divalent metal cation (Fe/Co/Zn/Cd) transporter